MIFLGIDVGSTTVKTVILNENNEILSKSYERHLAKPKELVLAKLVALKQTCTEDKICVAITGSAGMGLAKSCGIPFVQEVFATSLGVKFAFPKTDIVIEDRKSVV